MDWDVGDVLIAAALPRNGEESLFWELWGHHSRRIDFCGTQTCGTGSGRAGQKSTTMCERRKMPGREGGASEGALRIFLALKGPSCTWPAGRAES
jgi:hypothetical protein